jgi:hypothetical protein
MGFAITLKALANSSPGFALKPWVQESEEIRRNSEGVATVFVNYARRNSFRVAS